MWKMSIEYLQLPAEVMVIRLSSCTSVTYQMDKSCYLQLRATQRSLNNSNVKSISTIMMIAYKQQRILQKYIFLTSTYM